MGKKAKKVTPPDYKALATDQAAMNQAAVDKQTAANRPDQYDANGNSLIWSVDPTTGKPVQKVNYSPEQQALHDAEVARQQGMSDMSNEALQKVKANADAGYDTSNLPEVTGYDFNAVHPAGGDLNTTAGDMKQFDPSDLSTWGSLDFSSLGDMPDGGFGAVKAVQDAMMARLRPGLDQGRAQEIQRLKAQGLGETDEATTHAYDTLNRKDVDAENQALLGATTEAGNIFQRQLQARQQGAKELQTKAEFDNTLRGLQSGEKFKGLGFNNDLLQTQFDQNKTAGEYATALRNQGIGEQGLQRGATGEDRDRMIKEALQKRGVDFEDYQRFSGGGGVTAPNFEDFSKAGGAPAADLMTAEQKAYEAKQNAANADAQAKAGLMGGALKLVGGVAGGMIGGPVGAGLGASLGGMLGGKAKTVTPDYGGYSFSGGGSNYGF